MIIIMNGGTTEFPPMPEDFDYVGVPPRPINLTYVEIPLPPAPEGFTYG